MGSKNCWSLCPSGSELEGKEVGGVGDSWIVIKEGGSFW